MHVERVKFCTHTHEDDEVGLLKNGGLMSEILAAEDPFIFGSKGMPVRAGFDKKKTRRLTNPE